MARTMDGTGRDDLMRQGWDALAAADWEAARAGFAEACELEEDAESLDGLGRALHFRRDYAAAIEVTERAFAAYRQQDRIVEAADRARWLAFLHGAINCNMAAASGWMGRAATLMGELDECPGHGWLAFDRAPLTDDVAERQRLAMSALAIARRFGDADLEYGSLALLGETHVAAGRIAEGMRLIDEAMAAVSAGEVVGVVPVGDIYCRLLSACETALDVARAEQWMAVAGRFDAWSDWVSPVCRSHYGGILVAVGRWSEAEEELTAAIRAFEHGYRLMRASPLVKLADLRVRQGRIEEARHLLRGNESHPLARRALATIALAQGDARLAEELARLCLEGEPASHPNCAPALDLLVQARLTGDQAEAAAEAADQLAGLAEDTGDPHVAAFAELSTGRVRAAASDERASAHLQAALRGFTALDLPLEAARAQLELAGAIARSSPQAALEEARRALQTFERIGATADADATAGLLRQLGSAGRAWPKRYGELTKRETELLPLLAEGLSNAEIGGRLYISPRTAEHHVASILSKLGLRSRAEAAAYAVRERSKDR
jgi:DNA-binding NarL/FixJ family response regulator